MLLFRLVLCWFYRNQPAAKAPKSCSYRIITNSSFDTPSRPLIVELGWKTIEELIGNETKAMVFKSLNDLAQVILYIFSLLFMEL